MTCIIALVSCVSRKAGTPKPARDLYISDWFCKASAYAEKISDQWYILSAKYGLVAPDKVIPPYEQTLNKMPASERRTWAYSVIKDLEGVLQPGDRVILLAGSRYREHLVEAIERIDCEVQIPMQGLRIGEQLSWLNRELGK